MLVSRAAPDTSACREAMRSSMGSRPAASARRATSAGRCQRRVLRTAKTDRARPTMALEPQHPLAGATLADVKDQPATVLQRAGPLRVGNLRRTELVA